MAERESQEDFTQLLTCSLCMEYFKEPRALPCLHTFCLQCLEQLVATSKNLYSLVCPMCKEEHRIPETGVAGFRQDFRIKQLTHNLKSQNGEGKVGLQMHRCHYHPNLEIELICNKKECQKKLICLQCLVESHNEHPVVRLKQVYEDMLVKEKRANICQSKIEENIKTLSEVKEELSRYRAELKSTVTQYVKEYQRLLTKWSEQIYQDIDEKTEKECQRASEEIKFLSTLKDKVNPIHIHNKDDLSTLVQRTQLQDNTDVIEAMVEKWDYSWTKPNVCLTFNESVRTQSADEVKINQDKTIADEDKLLEGNILADNEPNKTDVALLTAKSDVDLQSSTGHMEADTISESALLEKDSLGITEKAMTGGTVLFDNTCLTLPGNPELLDFGKVKPLDACVLNMVLPSDPVLASSCHTTNKINITAHTTCPLEVRGAPSSDASRSNDDETVMSECYEACSTKPQKITMSENNGVCTHGSDTLQPWVDLKNTNGGSSEQSSDKVNKWDKDTSKLVDISKAAAQYGKISEHYKFTGSDHIKKIAYYSASGKEYISVIGEKKIDVLNDKGQLVNCQRYDVDSQYSIAGLSVDSVSGHHFILDQNMAEIRGYNWPVNLAKKVTRSDTKQPTSFSISCTPNYVFYTHFRNKQITVTCKTADKFKKVVWHTSTGLEHYRTMNALEKSNQIIVLVSNYLTTSDQSCQSTIALKGIQKEGDNFDIYLYQFSAEAIFFDFCSIDNDGDNFYVLNSKSRLVSVISTSGDVLGTIVRDLLLPTCLSINKETKRLAIVEQPNRVKIYNLH